MVDLLYSRRSSASIRLSLIFVAGVTRPNGTSEAFLTKQRWKKQWQAYNYLSENEGNDRVRTIFSDMDDAKSTRKGAKEDDDKQSRRMRRQLKRRLNSALTKVVGRLPGMNDKQKRINQSLTRELFESLDQDKDGILTEEEVLSAGLGLTSDDVRLLDKNRDGRVSREELRDGVNMAYTSSDAQDVADEIEDTLGVLEPLERQEMRLEGFEPYILVSVLTAEGSYGMVSEMNNVEWAMVDKMISDKLPFFEILFAIDWLSIAILLSAGSSVITAMYATTVFSLSILYGKTALGMSRDGEYYEFMQTTALQRIRAFQAFSIALLSFSVSVLLLVTERAPPPFRWPLAIASMIVMHFASTEYNSIVLAARPIFDTTSAKNSSSTQ